MVALRSAGPSFLAIPWLIRRAAFGEELCSFFSSRAYLGEHKKRLSVVAKAALPGRFDAETCRKRALAGALEGGEESSEVRQKRVAETLFKPTGRSPVSGVLESGPSL